MKPLLALGEFGAIAAILTITRAGGRSGWHTRWLRSRRLAERLRCLDLSARLGDLMLREGGTVAGEERIVGRALGLPDAVADGPYLAGVHARLLACSTTESATSPATRPGCTASSIGSTAPVGSCS